MKLTTLAFLLCTSLLLTTCSAPQVRPAGPAVQMPALTSDALVARDGARLPMSRWLPNGRARANVIALHSFGDYRKSFEELGTWLAERGIAVYAYDQRGFGAAPHPGIWPGEAALVDDLADAIAALRASPGGADTPLFLLGESMGGGVAMIQTARAPAGIDGLILAEPAVREGIYFRYLWDAALWTAARTAPAASVTVSRTWHRDLSPAAQARLGDDPLVVREVRADTYDGLIDLTDSATAAAERIATRTLLLFGRGTGIVKKRSLCYAFADLDGDVTGIQYPGAPHLLLHARDWQRIARDIERWVGGEAPPSLTAGGVAAAAACG